MALSPVIQVSPMGALGNRMIQYMAALALADRVPGARFSKIHLPEWGVQIPPVDLHGVAVDILYDPVLDFTRAAAALNSGAVGCIDIRSYAQQMENFGTRAFYEGVFGGPAVAGAGPDELLINIRGGDILDGHHPDYVLVPIEFYAELVEVTGLRPVFMGQLDPSPYLDALRDRFAQARWLPSRGAVADFACIRASCNIVPAISTFSWLAAWLSGADRVFMPVLGLFHPLQARTTMLLPLDDARFRFTLFPYSFAIPVGRFATAHAALRGLWRGIAPGRLRSLLARPAIARDQAAYLAAFDEAFYLARYPDIAGVVAAGHMPSGLHHYTHFGFAEGREAFAVDRAWYCETYPIAAVELGQGDAADVIEHYVTLGRERGYRRSATDSRIPSIL